MKYLVHFEATASTSVMVDSDMPPGDAVDAAYDELPGDVCAHCAGWGQSWSRDEGEWQVTDVADENGEVVWSSQEGHMGGVIEITQDYEFDEDCGLGAPMSSFWATGHGHDPDGFIRAVIDHTLAEHGSVPRIEPEDRPTEMWQRVIDRRDGVEYSRESQAPDESVGRYERITLLDLERPARGGTRCGVSDCGRPWSSGRPAIVRVEANDKGPTLTGPYMTVRMWFCREHGAQFPEPSYRVCMVPVGAEIVLPAPA